MVTKVYVVYRMVPTLGSITSLYHGKVEKIFATEEEAVDFITDVAMNEWDSQFGISMQKWVLDKYP